MKKYLVIVGLFVTSCALNNGEMSRLDYLERGTRADVKNFFNGKMEGFAIVQDQQGDISDTISIDVEASWESNKGVIKQTYTYANSEKDSRTWLVTLDNGGDTFTAIGHDVASPAKGRKVGNAIQMAYSLLLPSQMRGQKEEVKFDDKYYLIDEDSAIVISQSSAGFGQVKRTIISLKKLDAKRNSVPKQLIKKEEIEKEVEKTSYRAPVKYYKQPKVEQVEQISNVDRAVEDSLQVEEANINKVASSEGN